MPPKRPLPRKRQTTINFSSTPKPAPKPIKRIELIDSEEDESSPDRPAKRRRFEEETERAMKMGMPVQRGGMFDSSDVDLDLLSSSTDSDGSASETYKKSKSGNSGKKQKKQKKGKRKGRSDSSSNEESEGVVEVVVPKKTRSGKLRKEVAPGKESANEVQLVTRHKTHGKGKRRSPTPVDDSDEQMEEEEAPRRRTRRGRANARKSTPEEISSDNDQSGSEQGEGQGTPDGGGDSEEDELKEELAFLQSSPVADRGRLRSTGNKVKSSREMALEALKKRRADTNEPSSSAATPGRKKPVIHDSDSESEPDLQVIKEENSDMDDDENEEDDEIEDDDDDTTNAHDIFRSTNEDDDFIVDEDEGLLGAPAHDNQMPLEFTSMSTAKPRDLFKYAVEWSVHKKINPSFDSSDQIYELTFRKLDDEANGLANSKFHSTAWQSDFSRAIHARPEFIANEIGRGKKDILEAHCEACNRKNHPASWEISLTGPAYLKDTQEPVEEDSENSDDSTGDSDDSSSLSSTSSSGEKAIYNAVGERIPPESRTYTLGSTCKANAEVTHTLLHWRYHLHGWVVGYLEREGHFKPDQLVKREKWSDRKRFKKANKIVDRMEKDGEIRRLHRLYKQRIDFAAEAKNEFTEGWGRRGR